MEEAIKTILKENKELLGETPILERINVGFTNTIYIVNNEYILKICMKEGNEKDFLKEIEFYQSNPENHLIPRLYKASTDKKSIPYYYEILEKVEGVSLYNVWHTLSEKEREYIIKQLCTAMKSFHKNCGKKQDWEKEIKNQFNNSYEQAKKRNLLSKEEIDLLDKAYLNFSKYLDSNEFVLVHNDLHFDNIIYHNGKIKLIDFERSIFAPKDFELDILYRMIRKPWKFASEETESFVKASDYENIMIYIEKYYPELIHTKYLYQRLAIYDIVYFLKQYIEYPHVKELEGDIMKAVGLILR